jgi:hypothetical protein
LLVLWLLRCPDYLHLLHPLLTQRQHHPQLLLLPLLLLLSPVLLSLLLLSLHLQLLSLLLLLLPSALPVPVL